MIFIILLAAVLTVAQDPIKCMNYYGLETPRKSLVCDWVWAPTRYLEFLKKEMSINLIRVPFSYEYVRDDDMHNMDNLISECHRLDLQVILDYHRTWEDHQGPTPEEKISMQDFIDCWIKVLYRYERYPNVVGVGIFNEIQSSDDFEYTMNMHRKVMDAIEIHMPKRFRYFVGCPGWGGNCSMMDPTRYEPYWDRTYIEVHKYIFSGESNFKDWEISMPRRIASDHWFIGETGWKHNIDEQREWAEGFLSYLKSRRIYNVCAWTIAHSGDTDGWWHDDCTTFNYEKAALLETLWYGSFKSLRGSALLGAN